MAFIRAFFIGICNDPGYTEGLRVEGRLRYQAIWKGNTKKPSNAGCEAEKEKIPVKSCWFLKRELGTLSNQG